MRNRVMLCLVSVCLLGLGLVSGCGSGATSGGGGGGGSSVSYAGNAVISGTAAASQSDLAQLGVSTMAHHVGPTISGSNAAGEDDANYLLSKGVRSTIISSTNHIMTVSSAEAILCVMDNDGNLVATGITTTVEADGDYTFTGVKDGVQFVVKIVKTGNGKVLQMTAPAYVPTGSTEARQVTISPQTTLVVESIINSVVKVLKTANVDPAVIESVKAVIIDTIASMISAGTLQLPSMVTTSEAADNSAMGSASDLIGSSGDAKDSLDGMRMGAGMAAGSGDITKASEFIREVFTVMTGSADNVPEVMVQGFAEQYVAGRTFTIGQMVGAANGAILVSATGAPAVGISITTQEVIDEVNGKLNFLYTSLEAKQAGATYEVDVPPVILAVFPPDQKASLYPLTATTSITVPQMLLIVQGMMDKIHEKGSYDLDPGRMCQAVGITIFTGGAGGGTGLMIMGADVRTTNYSTPGAYGTPVPAIESYVCVQNVTQSGVPDYTGVTVALSYPKSGGGTGTANYSASTMGGGPGGKQYVVSPYGNNGTTPVIKSDFTGGTCTITLSQNGVEKETKQVTLVVIDNFGDVDVSLTSPSKESFTMFPTGATPVFSWTTNMNGVTIPSGYRLAYVVNIGKTGGGGGGWTDVWNSWNRKQFIYGTSFPSPITYEVGANYSINVSPVVLSQSGGNPINQGKCTNASFMMGTPTPETFNISGAITPFGGTTIEATDKVGLFCMASFESQSAGASISPIVTGTIGGDHAYTLSVSSTQFSMGKNYQLIAWEDANSNGKIDMGNWSTIPSTPPEWQAFSNKNINCWGGQISIWDNMTGMNSPLKYSLTGFNCDLTMNGYRF